MAPCPFLPGARWAPAGASAGCAPLRALAVHLAVSAASRPPGPSAGRGASASWRTGAGWEPRAACPVGGCSSGSGVAPMAPRLPRPASELPSTRAALFPPLRGTGQTGFSAPGRCLSSPSGSRGRQARLGLRMGQGVGAGGGPYPSALPSVPPRGGEGAGRQAPGRSSQSGRSGPGPASCASRQQVGTPRAVPPASALANFSGSVLLRHCSTTSTPPVPRHLLHSLGRTGHHTRSMTEPARKAGGVVACSGPELPW